ncbi:hypothetical protein, partial [Bacillus glycinifermentans]|uniref:hypothetical protein n=1 Tax=Bacillus glycinifermentans TaxID=1664069 RepID=UPI002E79B68C
ISERSFRFLSQEPASRFCWSYSRLLPHTVKGMRNIELSPDINPNRAKADFLDADPDQCQTCKPGKGLILIQ